MSKFDHKKNYANFWNMDNNVHNVGLYILILKQYFTKTLNQKKSFLRLDLLIKFESNLEWIFKLYGWRKGVEELK